MTPDIALAASVRVWPDRLHRFLLDHGGGRIVDRVMTADQASGGGFDVLLIDDVCSFLTPRLVSQIKGLGAEVIGVYVPEDGSDAKRRLLECGISDVIESEATPEEFVEKVSSTLSQRIPVAPADLEPRRSPLSIGVTGPSAGVGTTEVSIALAGSLSDRLDTVLIDLDPVWPSIAQRLDLPLHPNVRTALDHALHAPERLAGAIHEKGRLKVVGGRADGGRSDPIGRHEALTLVDALGAQCDVVIADLGPLLAIEGGLAREFDAVVVVGSSTPVGVARLMRALEMYVPVGTAQSTLSILNMTTTGFQRAEAVAELTRGFPGVPVLSLPFDRRIAEAAWDGTISSGRTYRRAVDSMSDLVASSLS